MSKILKALSKRNYKSLIAFGVLAFLSAFWFTGYAHAKYASIIVDADTGRVLHQTNADTRNYPASLTKMMTLYVVFDALDAGEISLKTKFKVSRRAANQPASRLGLKRNQTITVEQAILSLVTKSANDVASVIAENLSKTERAFALKMTATARKIGMNRTTFRNASGLPHRGQLSTARDMSKLARALLTTHAKYYSYFSVKNFKYKGRSHKNHNKLLTSYEGVDGIKTGYIRASGFNLVASAKRSGQRLIGVVFGGNSSKHRNQHMTNLLNKGFSALDQGGRRIAEKSPTPSAPSKSHKVPSKQVAESDLSSKSVNGASWTVQVGAFARYGQAYEAAQTAVDIAPKSLKHGLIKVVPLKKRNGRVLHRARILGVSKRQAYKACRSLKKNNMNCMEISGKKALKVASIK